MKILDEFRKNRAASLSSITDYETFLAENQKRVNLLLNRFLWFCILIGPALMAAIRAGVFHSVAYSTCIIVSMLVLALACIHYVLVMKKNNTVRAAIIAFLAIDTVLILMNSAHIGIYMTWFVVPLISLLFCDFRIYFIAVAINYAMMTLSVWIVSPYYASLRVDFDTAFQYFAGRIGGFSIETVIMVVAGYALCRVSTAYYRDLIEKHRMLSATIEDMKAQKEKEAQLIQISMTDELTCLYNRRCYDADMEAYRDKGMEESFVIFSVDVNGLKETNDTKGHAAGDELLVAAADCLAQVFEPIGKVYRTGGDEFLAFAETSDPKGVLEQIKRVSERWRGEYGETLSLSVGYATHREYPEANIHSLEILSDQMMYQEKSRYYSTPGMDRRRIAAT